MIPVRTDICYDYLYLSKSTYWTSHTWNDEIKVQYRSYLPIQGFLELAQIIKCVWSCLRTRSGLYLWYLPTQYVMILWSQCKNIKEQMSISPGRSKGQKDKVTPGNAINRRTQDTGQSIFCFIVLYLLLEIFPALQFPPPLYFTYAVLICWFAVVALLLPLTSPLSVAHAGVTFQTNTIVEME